MDENMTNTETEAEVELEAEQKIGNIKIAPDVVATIASIAINEVEGVAGMYKSIAGGIADILTKKSQNKGVKVDITGEKTIVDLSIIVDYGVRIPELAWTIQDNVKNSIETMTGLSVEKVNIHVEGVSFEKANKEKTETANNNVPEIIVEETTIDEIKADDELPDNE